MLHYSCDLCKRAIDSHADVRHVVKIEVFQAVEEGSNGPSGSCCEDREDDDHLEEMQELLEGLDDHECAGLLDDRTVSLRFDLCDSCRQRFVKNPLGMKTGKKLDFSQN